MNNSSKVCAICGKQLSEYDLLGTIIQNNLVVTIPLCSKECIINHLLKLKLEDKNE